MNACPSGWHLPSKSDFETLITKVADIFIERMAQAGKKLKSASGWGENGYGEDAFGFSALPAGSYYHGAFNDDGYYALFWSATEIGSDRAYSMYMKHDYDGVFLDDEGNEKILGFSVRCLKD
jgi:uncharacterized protein (TIGR02145 family)